MTKKETGKPKFVEVRCISLLSLFLQVPSADNLCKQFGPISGLTKRQVCSGYKLFDSLMVFLIEFFERFILGKISRWQKLANLPSRQKLTYSIMIQEYVLFWKQFWLKPGPEVIKLFSCSTQLSTKFQLLIRTKIPTNKEVSWLKSLRYCIYHTYKCENANNCWHFNIYGQGKFLAQLRWAWKKFYNLKTSWFL